MGPLRMKAPWRLYSDVYTPGDGEDRLGLKLALGPVRVEGGEWPSMETSEVSVLMGAKAPRLDESPQDAHLGLHTEQLRATWGGATMTGQVHVEVDARQMDVERGSMGRCMGAVEAGECLRTEGRRRGAELGRPADVPRGHLDVSPLSARGRFSGNFSNAVPFVALLTFKGALPGALSPLLKANNLMLSGAVSLGEKASR